jgi:hypothetical protein
VDGCELSADCNSVHAIISHDYVFFRGSSVEEVQDQVVARVGRKSAVALSGMMEASYSHFLSGEVREVTRSFCV